MRFVPLKTAEQQSALMMHRARDLLIRQRTMLVNALRGHLAEFGLVEAQGLHKVARLIAIVMGEMDGLRYQQEQKNRPVVPVGLGRWRHDRVEPLSLMASSSPVGRTQWRRRTGSPRGLRGVLTNRAHRSIPG
jgi:hypothetical protein